MANADAQRRGAAIRLPMATLVQRSTNRRFDCSQINRNHDAPSDVTGPGRPAVVTLTNRDHHGDAVTQ
ncbi:hypothetical protein I1A62_08865 [Rhodococcus sp. USK10]|uniref:hypothetical protein n=1 Tax=Rhodococcus sp. USK10 TaxID=2789739 RepID=UPI001C5E1997|nr:hypothetical protein [Rhodococcus sp. USK10]QYB04569.1 hypothetical protein I1A62_08865 [Rhodococcus sp. USK10]